MPRYRAAAAFRASNDGIQYDWPAGQVVDLTPEQAAWVNRAAPGTLSPAEVAPARVDPDLPKADVTPPTRKATPRNRQHRPSRDRSA